MVIVEWNDSKKYGAIFDDAFVLACLIPIKFGEGLAWAKIVNP